MALAGERYLRFVVGGDDENGAWLTGVFRIAGQLRRSGELYQYEAQQLDSAFDWFGTHLPCPPFSVKQRKRKWTADAVCWFRSGAREPIERIWDIVAVLRERDLPVRLLTSDRPGRIVYHDRFQIVAETMPWA